MSDAFEVEGLVKRFHRTTAPAGVALHARRGTVLGGIFLAVLAPLGVAAYRRQS